MSRFTSTITPPVADGSIYKEDLNTTDTGHAVVTKIKAGTNVQLVSSGVDSGTGEVTINVSSTIAAVASITASNNNVVKSTQGKLNFINSGEFIWTIADDPTNKQINVTPLINKIDFNKLSNKPSTLAGFGLGAEVSTIVSTHASDMTLHLTPAQNTLLDNLSVFASDINLLSGIASNVQTQLNSRALTAGDINQNFSVADLNLSGNILPVNSTQDIGSATNRFRTIYVNEAKLSTNTLYIGDTAILGTTAQTVNIHADADQSIDIKTTGTGTTVVGSEKAVIVTTSGQNADVFLNATGQGSNVRIGATNEVQISAPVVLAANFSGTNQSLSGNLTIGGNLTVNGSQTVVNSTTVSTKDNIITLNAGEVGSGVTLGKAGIQIDRGDQLDFELVFDEFDDMFKVGGVGTTLETLATREFTNSTYSINTHNHSLNSLNDVTTNNKQVNDVLKWNGTHFVNGTLVKAEVGLGNVDDTTDLNKPISTATQAALDTKVNKTNYVVDQALKAPLANPTFTGTVSGITKAMVGLSNVDNTADTDKPISSATQVTLNTKADKSDTYTKAETDLKIQIADGNPWLVKSSAYTALAGDRLFVDTGTSAVAITLPATPSVGDAVTFTDYSSSFSVNNLTILRNGSNIVGQAQDLVIDNSNTPVRLVYSGNTKGWIFNI